jgi:hypothetical protein
VFQAHRHPWPQAAVDERFCTETAGWDNMRTLQLYAIWVVISIGVAGMLLAWRLM